MIRTPGICCKRNKLKEIQPGCAIRNYPVVGCVNKRRLARVIPPIGDLWLPYVHGSCACNEIVAVHNRVCGIQAVSTPQARVDIKGQFKRMASRCQFVVPYTTEQFLNCYTGVKRERYRQAAESLQAIPLCRKDANIQAFVKAEKINPEKLSPDPRLIQYRNMRYNIVIGRVLKAMEKQLYAIKVGSFLTPGIAKCLNSKQRAAMLLDKYAKFKQPVVYTLDCSRFDGHVTPQMLECELNFYISLCPNDLEFSQAIKWQMNNKCYTSNGIRYRTTGKRCSGDMNTALGNCMLMIAMISAAMRTLKVKIWDIIDDGDDCLLFIESDEEHKLAGLADCFATYGQELKLENRATNIYDIVFCQTRLFMGKIPRMVRSWRKVLAQGTSGSTNWPEKAMVKPMCHAVGLCEFALNQGVPIMEEYALALIRNGNGKIPKRFTMLDAGAGFRAGIELNTNQTAVLQQQTIVRSKITVLDRVHYWQISGVLPQRQVEIENILRGWKFTPTYLELPHENESPGWMEDVSPAQFLPGWMDCPGD